MGNIGLPELLVVLAIAVFLFGAGRLPKIGEGLGKAIRNFKEAYKRGKPGADKDERD